MDKFLCLLFLVSIILMFIVQQNNNEKLKKSYEHIIIDKNKIMDQYKLLLEKDKEIDYLKQYDNLTKLPNRNLLNSRLQESFKERKVSNYSLFFIDIDNFKNINETLGHDYGDELLFLVGKMLKDALSEDYSLFRWGGDEFVIILEKSSDKGQLSQMADEIANCLDKKVKMCKKQIYITLSIGIAVFPIDASNSKDLVKNAEIAMYHAKDFVGNKHVFYTKELEEKINRKEKIQKCLRNAILQDELSILYQPQYSIKHGNIIAYEALLRWKNEELGEVSPNEFIPIAEQSNLIISIGNWILKNACRQNSIWVEAGFKNIVAVNISAVQFEQKNFILNLKNILSATNLKPEFLELEITETVLIKSFEKSIETIKKIKLMGINVSLDDFGTGYSSLSYLKKLPIDKLKIDKCFTDDICISNSGKLILQGIVRLAHTINLEVIAEGVETEEQAKKLEEFDCDIAQGFLFSRPINNEKMEELLREKDEGWRKKHYHNNN